MSEASKRKLGEILVERGFISEEQLQQALSAGKRLGEALLEMGALSADELNWALSELLGVPYVEFRDEMVDFDLARSMPEEVLRRHLAFPVLKVDNELTVIMADPTNRQALVELEAFTGARVSVAIAAREAILHLLDRAFPRGAGTPGRMRDAGVEVVGAAVDEPGIGPGYQFLVEALVEGATEIHLEPTAQDLRVRHRVEGRLVERTRLPRHAASGILLRIRARFGLGGASLPCRTARRTRIGVDEVEVEAVFYPTLHGEALAARIWRSGAEAPSLESLALEGPGRDALPRLGEGPGLVLATGSDPRARAAVLYALARAAAAAEKKVVTVERAVSYVVPDFVQVELAGDFDDGAATILGQPADVVLVEDLAASRTCLAAVDRVEQGALVLGGLGAATNGSALARLLDRGLPPALFLGAVRALVQVERRGSRHHVEVLSMTEERRAELLPGGQGPWTSRTC